MISDDTRVLDHANSKSKSKGHDSVGISRTTVVKFPQFQSNFKGVFLSNNKLSKRSKFLEISLNVKIFP